MKYALVLLTLFFASLSAEVHVKVNRKNVKRNDTITVVFSSDEKAQPDFSPLERDFTILSQNKSSNTSIYNGRIEHEYRWTLGLVCKREGEVVIPSIQFGSTATSPQIISVAEATPPTKGDPLYFEVDIFPKEGAIERAQILYTLRFYRAVNLFSGHISEPKTSDPDALIEQIGEEREYDQIQNGTRYVILERTYAIFPQHTGTLTIFPTVFEGQMMAGGGSLFHMQTQFTRIESEERSVEVKPIPSPFTRRDWFAAEAVSLSDEWSSDSAHVVAGEPITRTVTISADGCLASQIPALNLNLPADIKQYPDNPKNVDQVGPLGNRGIRQLKVALLPTEAGSIKVPEIVLKWWDVKNGEVQEAILPPVELTVVGSPVLAKEEAIQREVVERVPLWAWGLISLHGVWVVLFLMRGRKEKPSLQRKPSLRHLKKRLKKSCFSHDAKETERCLLEWARLKFPEEKIQSLSSLKENTSEEFGEEIGDLQRALYGQVSQWEGEALYRAFQKKQKKGAKEQGSSNLHSLLYKA